MYGSAVGDDNAGVQLFHLSVSKLYLVQFIVL
jgi:hypothetical protein